MLVEDNAVSWSIRKDSLSHHPQIGACLIRNKSDNEEDTLVCPTLEQTQPPLSRLFADGATTIATIIATIATAATSCITTTTPTRPSWTLL